MGRRQLPCAMNGLLSKLRAAPRETERHPAPWTKPLARRQEEPTSAAQEP